jgi:hypothetical protein
VKYVPIHPTLSEWQFIAAFLGDEPANVAARVFLSMVVNDWLADEASVQIGFFRNSGKRGS